MRHRSRIWFFALVVLAAAAHASGEFVAVRDGGFVLGDKPFRFVGANNYYLVYKPECMAEDVFASAAAMGLRVIRTWAFLDGESHDGIALQPEPGKFDDEGFRRLDRVLEQASRHGLKLVLTLVNRWDDFGGMRWYVDNAGRGPIDEFYTRKETREAYKAYVRHVVGRVNSRTGIAYKHDPAIFAWQLANEPRCPSDASGDTLVAWAAEMSRYIKSMDPNHMVSVGDEGFYLCPGEDDGAPGGKEGVDWRRLVALPCVDYGTVHLYPDHWQKTPEWGAEWIRRHARDARKIGKPVVVEEFGLRDKSKRDAVYADWLATALSERVAGMMVWLMTGRQNDGSPYPDYDGFDLKYPGSTASVLSEYALKIGAADRLGLLRGSNMVVEPEHAAQSE